MTMMMTRQTDDDASAVVCAAAVAAAAAATRAAIFAEGELAVASHVSSSVTHFYETALAVSTLVTQPLLVMCTCVAW